MLRGCLKSSLFSPDGSSLDLYVPILIEIAKDSGERYPIGEGPPRSWKFVPVMKYEDVVKILPSDFTLSYEQIAWCEGQATLGTIAPNTPKHANQPRDLRFSLN